MAYHRLYWWDGTNATEADRYFIPVSGVPDSREIPPSPAVLSLDVRETMTRRPGLQLDEGLLRVGLGLSSFAAV